MKRNLILLFTLASSLSAVAARADDDRPVRFEELPAAAQHFIRTHFPDSKISVATVDREFMDTTWDVIFVDGTHIEFDNGGEWKEIECRVTFVPEGVVPPEIVTFLRERFPEARIRDIERDRRGYEVNLDNHRELHFDSRGRFRGYDD